ncbi:ubiquitin-like-specific protease 1C [Sorghum bicolor]|uniref:ubiquitin-like-specific protease 1C n=1 Tax=Sorghum bicolor TaxID=4558 RepID=UPI000B423AB5|nr:ubiquitin-like-specific protease 1C [Sorghum bicolor]|eukprot:XP_021321807.1 ubiquitin-like-specific protease 1C [Sorghum bicolor]
MVRKRSDIDWYSVFLAAFSHDGAVDADSDSPAPGPQAPTSPGGRQRFEEPHSEFERRFGSDALVDDEPHFRLTRATTKAAVSLGPDVDVPSASKGVDDFSKIPTLAVVNIFNLAHQRMVKVGFREFGLMSWGPVDEDEQEEHVSHEHCSKSSPKFSREKKNDGKLPMNKRKSQGHGGKRKPPMNKRMTHAIDPEESDYKSSLPSRFSERRKQQLQNSSSVHSRKVQDVVLLDDEDMKPKEEVNCEMSDRLNEPEIYYPSRDDREAVKITRSDIKCLDPQVFLSSHVINFYIKYIERTRLCNENFRDKFYIFNTYFFGKLEKSLHQPSDFPMLRRWWKSVNIFNNAYIILPIHGKEHWSLVIICLPPKEKISEPIILHLDSLGMHRSNKILNIVARYIETEWRFLSVADPAWPCLLSDIRKETVQVPQQNNTYDCGIFMLYYIEQFIKEAPARFTADKLDMFSRSWFKPEEASSLRQRIRDLLLVEFETARLDQCCRISVAESRERIKGIGVAESDEAKATGEAIGSTPILDAVSDSGVKRLEGNEDVTGSSMPIPDAVCEITGTKVWIKRVYRPTSGTTLEPALVVARSSCPATGVAAAAEEQEEPAGEEALDAVDQASGSRHNGRPIRKTKPNPKCVGPQWA